MQLLKNLDFDHWFLFSIFLYKNQFSLHINVFKPKPKNPSPVFQNGLGALVIWPILHELYYMYSYELIISWHHGGWTYGIISFQTFRRCWLNDLFSLGNLHKNKISKSLFFEGKGIRKRKSHTGLIYTPYLGSKKLDHT